MDNEQDYSQILDELLVGADRDDEVSRKMAYNACLAYAEENLAGDFAANAFIALAAERLRQVRVHFGVIKSMVPMPDDARLHLRYAPQGGPVLTGNRDGLRYLSDLCAVLADAAPPREITPEQIAAVEFYEDDKIPLPPPLYLRYDKLYRVLNCRPYSPEEEIWSKPPARDDGGRMCVFAIRDEAQEIFEIALDLDDAGIHYFTHSDLEQVWGVATQ